MSSADIESQPIEDSEIPETDLGELTQNSTSLTSLAINATSNAINTIYKEVVVIADSVID